MVAGVHHAATFSDSTGRRWPVSVTVLELLECERRLGIKLLELLDPESAESLRLSPTDKAEALLLVLDAELKRQGVSYEDFLKSLPTATHLQAAFEALAAALLSFYHPSPASMDQLARARTVVREVMDRSEIKADELLGTLLEKNLDELKRSTTAPCEPSPIASPGVA